jgi:hypothetical protein
LSFVRLSRPDHLRGSAARLRNHILLIAHGLIDQAFAIFTGAHHLVESILDLLGGIDHLQLQLRHDKPGFIPPGTLLDNLQHSPFPVFGGRRAQDGSQGVGNSPLLADQLSHVRWGDPDLEDHGVLALGSANGHQPGYVYERLRHIEEQLLETVS